MIKLKDLLIEATYENSRIIKIANSTNKGEIDKIKKILKNAEWTTAEINDAVKRAKEIIKKEEEEKEKAKLQTYEALPRKQKDWNYDQATSKEFTNARADWVKKFGTKSWNDRTYNKWIKDVASNGGKNHSYDMAQNAKYEQGLLQFVKKQIKIDYGDETPLERIQWDIEAS